MIKNTIVLQCRSIHNKTIIMLFIFRSCLKPTKSPRRGLAGYLSVCYLPLRKLTDSFCFVYNAMKQQSSIIELHLIWQAVNFQMGNFNVKCHRSIIFLSRRVRSRTRATDHYESLSHDSLDIELDSSIHYYHIAFRSYDPNQQRLAIAYNEHSDDSVSLILVLLQFQKSHVFLFSW